MSILRRPRPLVAALLVGMVASVLLAADFAPRLVFWGHFPPPPDGSSFYEDDPRYTAVASSDNGYAYIALRVDRRVVTWGPNATPAPAGLDSVVGVAAGNRHFLALKNNGTVVAWGDNTSGQTSVPTGLESVVGVAAAADYSLALRSDGSLVAWGSGGPFGVTDIPPALGPVRAVSAGGTHVLVALRDGTVFAWGNNNSGQTNVPPGLGNVVAVAAGYAHSMALRADGTVATWGLNDSASSITPPPDLNNVVAIAAVSGGFLAVKADGTCVQWHSSNSLKGFWDGLATLSGTGYVGLSRSGMLMFRDDGRHYTAASRPPVSLKALKKITANDNGVVALRQDGTLVSWGDYSLVPPDLSLIIDVSTYEDQVVAVRSDGSVLAWPAFYNPPPELTSVIAVETGRSGSLVALRADGQVVKHRPNFYDSGLVEGLTSVASIAIKPLTNSAYALKSDGNIIGYPDYGACVRIASNDYHFLGLRTDRTVYAGSFPLSSPAQLADLVPAGLNNVIDIAASSKGSAALRNDGSVVAWGIVSVGQSPKVLGELTNVSKLWGTKNFIVALCGDDDADLLPDSWEDRQIARYSTDALTSRDQMDSQTDFDADGLIDRREFELDTDPLSPDTDGDTLLDGVEAVAGLPPRQNNEALQAWLAESITASPALQATHGLYPESVAAARIALSSEKMLAYGVYSRSAIRAQRPDATFVWSENGRLLIPLHLERSDDLQIWRDEDDPQVMSVPRPANTSFFQLTTR